MEIPAIEIRWIESNDRRFLQPRLLAQEADEVGFHPVNRGNYIRFCIVDPENRTID
jgi:hypothetical protein